MNIKQKSKKTFYLNSIIHFAVRFKISLCIFMYIVNPIVFLNAQSSETIWANCTPMGCKLTDPYYVETSRYEWSGACTDGKADGFGTCIKYENNILHSTYTGYYKNGVRTGAGKFTRHQSNDSWEGQFTQGQLNGVAKYLAENGNRYEGNFINYTLHGKGKKYFGNGATFEGTFRSFKEYNGVYTNQAGDKTFLYHGNPVTKKTEDVSDYNPEINQQLTEYFDENWKRCTPQKASYYRRITYSAPNTPKGKIMDFYMSGQKQSEFYCLYIDYADDNLNFHVGEAKWYFPNGNISRKCNYYFTNRIQGPEIRYYDNGNIASEIHYELDVLHGKYNTFHKTGQPKIVATYHYGSLVDNKYIEYDENGLGAIVYNENFYNNSDKWVGNTENSQSEISQDGKIALLLKENKTSARFNYITLNQNSSYSIESTIQNKTGKGNQGYGIIFGFKDWNDYYQFLISEYGSYIILGVFEGIEVKICEWTQSNVINTGNQRNLLKVMKFNDEFIFSINGQVVLNSKSKTLRGNQFGIIAGGSGIYFLENLVVKEFITLNKIQEEAQGTDDIHSDEWKGNGSGFFIHEKGYIATNYHVVKDATEIRVEYFTKGIKQSFNAKIIVTDKQNDLAVIQIQDTNFKGLATIPYAFHASTRDVGTDVFALGYPIANIMGAEIKFTDGKISSKTGIQGDITMYQISVPIQPGNSGGPLFDTKGNLVGITTATLNKDVFNTENVNYAIKSSYLKNLIDVMPETIVLPNNTDTGTKPLTEIIKTLSDFVPLIRVK